MGKQVIEIPNQLNENLKNYIRSRDLKDGDKLIEMRGSGNITQALRNKGLSTRRLRNVFDMFHHGENSRIQQEDARKMLHSTITAERYYYK